MAMASVLAEMPDLCDRMLNEHLPDSSGRCAACRDELGTQASWPCLTYTVAEKARALSTGGNVQPISQPRKAGGGKHSR
ncbi:hypothetical protein [Sciscionella sediminilitoris]|uniref:hypothetical protein n=1 Tax=Sciscionella sediminilitoris TaxID=1445613 RepID=UPI0012E0D459|nr:hypothetical protein [Sciscionella sp. SE31]